MSISDSGQYDLLDQLAEEFARRFRRGERPALKEYTDRYPELAEEIRELFPAMVRVEQAEGVRQGEEEEQQETGDSRAANPPLRQIGDYRILREIGRGGMGVVYEAEQVSLGRRVALKVLPRQVCSDRMTVERFRREARAAARLHHTNIVPVYEVGQDGDVRFYAMQFIQGQGLEAVITELQRLRDRARSESKIEVASEGESVRPREEHSAPGIENPTLGEGGEISAVLQYILTDRFDPGGRSPELAGDSPSMLARALAGGLARPTGFGMEGCAAESDPALVRTETESATAGDTNGPQRAHPPAPAVSLSAAPSSSSAILPGGAQLSAVESGRRGFFRSLAHIGRQVAGGLAYAHARGIVHRDIKPSNLLLDTEGVVWIADFGLAKGDDEGLTHTGDILGTLRYMAPERFRGEGDARADVYALGLTLYELLTLRSGFDSSDRLKLIEQIKTEEPQKPRAIDARIPRDLETIVLKAIEKDPKARYQSAEAMSEDLRRFLADEPIQARQVSAAERYWRWARRNPVIAVLGGVLTAALVLGTAVSMYFAIAANRNAAQSLANAHRADEEAHRASQAAQRAQLAAERELSLRQTSEGLLARVALKEGVSRCEQSEVGHGLLWLTRALEFAGADQPDLQREIRLNIDRWSRAAPHLRYVREFLQRVNAVAVSPDGARALAGSEDGTAQLWELASGRPISTALRHGGPVSAVAFSPDGTLALTAARDGRARLWTADTGQEVRPALDHGGPIETVDFSPDGRYLATAGPNRCARLWDLSSGRSTELRPRPDLPQPALVNSQWYVRFAPDGTRLITTRIDWRPGQRATSQLWAVPTCAPIGPEMEHDSIFIWSTTFDTEGKRVLTVGNDGSAWVWEVGTGRRKAGPFRHLDAVSTAAFSPDGRSFATGCGDGTVCLWNPATLDQRLATLIHPLRCNILVVAFRDDGRVLLSAGTDGVARLWDPVKGRPLGGPCLHPKALRGAAMDPRGRWILTGGDDGVARVWEAPTSVALLPEMSRANWGIKALAFSPDGSTILTGNDVGDVMLWDTARAVAIRPPLTSPGQILSVAFGPDGRVFATAGRKQPLRIYDRQTGRPICELTHPAVVTGLAFRSQEGTLLAGGEDGIARLWDIDHGRPIGPALVHGASIRCVAISRDGRLAVTAGDDGRALIWELDTYQRVSSLGHPAKVLDVAFRPDGASLLTGCADGKARLWDLEQRRVLREFVLGQPVNAVATSPDGRTLAAGGNNRTVSIWDTADGHLLNQWSERQSGFVLDLAYRPDGQAIAIGLGDGTTRLADVAYPIGGKIDELVLWSQVANNARLDEQGNLVRLEHREWTEAQRALAMPR